MGRPSQAQLEALAEFLEENLDVARGLSRTQIAKLANKRKWSKLSTTLNAMGGVIKNGPGWSKYWAEKKCALKKLCAQRARSTSHTDGGPQTTSSWSELELRLVAAMEGHSFATGNSQVAVDPFLQTERIISPIPMSPVQASSPLITDTTSDIVEDQPLIYVDRISSGQNPSTSTHSVPHSSRHRTRQVRLDAEFQQLARIEEKRVDAEAVTARALANIATSINKLADAVANIAGALLEISTKIQPSPPE